MSGFACSIFAVTGSKDLESKFESEHTPNRCQDVSTQNNEATQCYSDILSQKNEANQRYSDKSGRKNEALLRLTLMSRD